MARRSASSGAALADGVAALAAQSRHDATHTATAAAQRAGVLIAGPLGCAFCRRSCAWVLSPWWPGWPEKYLTRV
ncbi:putative bacterial type II secretion system protein F domain [Mycobacterium kansasii]|uniref:Putative bacterial type II secretion system protein F domain n=1 Tax=Mycobacterium kansasii TaxID=1768 RepID=A0A1V3XAC4_MYCKA|nr:putative bacterial type II secretion system protein F domain [Mycobacterium kansasii]